VNKSLLTFDHLINVERQFFPDFTEHSSGQGTETFLQDLWENLGLPPVTRYDMDERRKKCANTSRKLHVEVDWLRRCEEWRIEQKQGRGRG
jgi:hypothetical protein